MPCAKSLLVLGRVRTVFGVKGWLKVQAFVENIESLFASPEWILSSTPVDELRAAKQYSIVEVDDWKQSGKDLLVHFKGLDGREQAQQYGQQFIHLPREVLPALNDDEIYWHQLEGMQVFNLAGQKTTAAKEQDLIQGQAGHKDCGLVYERALMIGVVDHLMETGANDVLAIKPVANLAKTTLAKTTSAQATPVKEDLILVPYVLEHYVIDVDQVNHRILIDWHIDA